MVSLLRLKIGILLIIVAYKAKMLTSAPSLYVVNRNGSIGES